MKLFVLLKLLEQGYAAVASLSGTTSNSFKSLAASPGTFLTLLVIHLHIVAQNNAPTTDICKHYKDEQLQY